MGTEKYGRVVAVAVEFQESNVVIGSNVLSDFLDPCGNPDIDHFAAVFYHHVLSYFQLHTGFTETLPHEIVEINNDWICARTCFTAKQLFEMLKQYFGLVCGQNMPMNIWDSYDVLNKAIAKELEIGIINSC